MYIVGKSSKELEDIAKELGFEPYRGRQLSIWVYKKLSSDFQEMTDLPKAFRAALSGKFKFSPVRVSEKVFSRDGSVKFLFELPDGERVESVYIPDGDRKTVCVSSQVGCPLSCRFCVTGRLGFVRNLTVSEIVSQVWEVRREFPLTNVVFMGMGEPFLNMQAFLKASSILVDDKCFDFSNRKVTVSTAGVIPGILELAEKNHPVRLAVSLNSALNDTRDYLMPINRKYPLNELIDALVYYQKRTGKWVTLEFVMIKGINCGTDEVEGLAKISRRLKVKVNLIPFNENPYVNFKTPSKDEVVAFQKALHERGITAIVRRSRGQDVGAACGQLSAGYRPLSSAQENLL